MADIVLAEINPEVLKSVIVENSQLTERALVAIGEAIKTLPEINTETSVEIANQHEVIVNDLRVRGKEAIRQNKERRMVYTRQFDELKKNFTEQESAIQQSIDRLVNWSNEWNTEKLRRERLIEEQKVKEVASKNALIQFETDVINKGEESLYLQLAQDIEKMIQKFYSLNVKEVKEYVEQLKKYDPKITLPTDLNVAVPFDPNLIPANEIQGIYDKVYNAKGIEWANRYRDTMIAERDKLIELLPGRIEELKEIEKDKKKAAAVVERLKAEQEAREKEIAEQTEKAIEGNKLEAASEKMEVALEAEVTKGETKVTKGTIVKLKYAPVNHKEMLSVIQWWVSNTMPLLTIDELNKKLSFMRTAADLELNKGETINGVTTIEDVKTRARKTK